MKNSKLIIAFTILFVMLLIPITTKAETVQTGKFKYMPAFENVAEETYYYSDDYFKQSGKEDNEHLLAMSFNLAISTFEIQNYSYSKDLLEEIGFKDIKAEDMKEKPTLETIGTVMAHKEIDGHSIIAVAIRGEKYDSEWGNNFIVGKEGNAKGFNDSSKKVIKRVKDYIKENDLDDVKIWMVGYSRAGTIADLTGVYINKHLQEFNTTTDDLFIYTFEAPAASIDETKYDNIYDIKCVNDLIPWVYPSEWGFHTNGKVIEIGESETLKTYIGSSEQVEHSDIEMQEFYSQFFGWLTNRLSREVYAENLDEPVSKLLDIYFSKSTEDRTKLIKFFTEDVKTELLDNEENKVKLVGKVWAAAGHNSDYLYHDITDTIIEIIDGVKDSENGSVLTDEEYDFLKNSLYPIIRTLGPIILDDSNYYEGINYEEYYHQYAEDYYLSDEEMGAKYGKISGFSNGYDDGFTGNEKNELSYEENNEYGPDYFEVFKNNYIEAYLEGYELGFAHKDDLVAKAKYDATERAKDSGYYAGSHNEESIPYNEDLWKEEWMTEEYLNAYNEEYEIVYLEAYEEGKKNPVTEEEEELHEELSLYHVISLIKNMKTIMNKHYPQENLKLVHSLDSYYKPYYFTDGENQTIDVDQENESLTIKTSGHLEKLIKVQVDGKDLDETDYKLESGSTILTIKPDYLKTLSEGEHTLKLVYIDNTLETKLTIKNGINQEPTDVEKQQGSINQELDGKTDNPDNITINNIPKDDIPNIPKNDGKRDNPKTGDDIGIYIAFAILGTMGILAAIVVKE